MENGTYKPFVWQMIINDLGGQWYKAFINPQSKRVKIMLHYKQINICMTKAAVTVGYNHKLPNANK